MLVIVSVCKWTMIEVWSGSVRGSSFLEFKKEAAVGGELHVLATYASLL